MTTKLNLNDRWAAVKTTTRNSRFGGYIDEITFVNLDRYSIAHTYVDANNKNSRRWQKILAELNQGRTSIIQTLAIKGVHKSTGEPLVDADSPFRVIDVVELQEVVDYIDDKLVEPKDKLFSR